MSPPKATRRQQAKAETRRLILETAYELFEKNGYDKTTMRQLAKEAGVGLGTIFQHFPDKASIMLAAFMEDIAGIAYEAVMTMPEKGLRAQLAHTLEPLFHFYAARPNLSRALLREGLFAGPEATRMMVEQEAEFTRSTAAICAKAQADGELGPHISPMLMGETVWAFYFYVLIQGLRTDQFTAEAMLRRMLELCDQVLTANTP